MKNGRHYNSGFRNLWSIEFKFGKPRRDPKLQNWRTLEKMRANNVGVFIYEYVQSPQHLDAVVPPSPNGPITIAIRARFEYDSTTIRLRFERDTTSYEELCAFEQ